MKYLCIAVLVLSWNLVACGGGGSSSGTTDSSSSPPTQPATVSAGGIWSGYGKFGIDWTDFVAVVTESGRAYFSFDGNSQGGMIANVQVTTSGNVVTGGAYAPLPWLGWVLVPDRDPEVFEDSPNLSGIVVSRSSLDVKAAFPGSETLVIELSYQKASYERPSSLQDVAGNYVGYGIFPNNVVMNISGTGELFVQDPESGCVLNGRVRTINPAYNVYDLSFNFSNCSANEYLVFNGVSVTGLASLRPQTTFANTPDGNEYIHFMMSGMVGGIMAGDYWVFRRD